MSSVFEFLRRNRTKLMLASGAAAGGYFALQRLLSGIYENWDQSASKDFVVDAHTKEKHFEESMRNCNRIIERQIDDVLNSLDKRFCVCVDVHLDACAAGAPESAFDALEDPNTALVKRLVAEVYCCSLFVCALRVQSTILAGYCIARQLQNSQAYEHIQKMYLAVFSSHCRQAICELTVPIEQAVDQVFDRANLPATLTLEQVSDLFGKARTMFEDKFVDGKANICSLLFNVEHISNYLKQNSGLYSDGDYEIFISLLNDAQDVIETDDFRVVLKSSVQLGFRIIKDFVEKCIAAMPSSQEGQQSIITSDGDGGCQSTIDNQCIQELSSKAVDTGTLFNKMILSKCSQKDADQRLQLARNLINLDVLNCFASNIFESFSVPAPIKHSGK